jgi:hypothetical protein
MRPILAIVAGLVGGSLVNILLVNMNGVLIPLPEGADITSMEGLKASMALFQPIHFLMPWLGHALGTFAGAFIAAKLAPSHASKYAWGIAGFFFAGGIANALMLQGPMWFAAADLLLAYVPMGWLAIRVSGSSKGDDI